MTTMHRKIAIPFRESKTNGSAAPRRIKDIRGVWPVMKYGCQQEICFSPIDPCIFVEFFIIILGRFPRNVHTNCRNPPARSTTKKRKGRTIDLSYKFFPTRALTFSVKRDEFRYLVAVPSSSWRFLVRARSRPRPRGMTDRPPPRPKLATQRGDLRNMLATAVTFNFGSSRNAGTRTFCSTTPKVARVPGLESW